MIALLMLSACNNQIISAQTSSVSPGGSIINSSTGSSGINPASSLSDDVTSSIFENNTVATALQSLDSWVGDYEFYEFCPLDENMNYYISIYKENDGYNASIDIDGFQTLKRLPAEVSGDENSIKLMKNIYRRTCYELYDKGDILLSFERKIYKIYTFWGEIQPMLEENKSVGVCFWPV